MDNKEVSKKVILDPGDTFISSGPAFVWTVLGSCVTVILYSSRLKISAVCHAQLPQHSDWQEKCFEFCPGPCYKNLPSSFTNKFVTCAIHYMINSLNKLGVQNSEIEASLYGGASRFGIKFKGKGIGERNIAAAKELLARLNIRIKNEDTGGTVSRRIELDAESGEAKITAIKL